MTDQEHPTLTRRDVLKTGATSVAWLLSLSPITPALTHEFAQMTRDQPMTGARLADILQTERKQWNDLIAQVGDLRMEEPGVEGIWSVKEVIAHLTWYERRVVEGARQVFSTGKFTRPENAGLSMDERNAKIAAESRSRPLRDVLTESDSVYNDLLTIVAACPQEILNDAQRFGLPGDVAPWMAIANNTYIHYREHAEAVRGFLARTT